MRNTLLLVIGIGLALAGSLMVTGSDLVVRYGGILLGVVGGMCVLFSIFRGWRQMREETAASRRRVGSSRDALSGSARGRGWGAGRSMVNRERA